MMKCAFAICLGLAVFALSLEAQLNRGSISGTLTDGQNGLLAAATVVLTNEGTNIVQTTSTNEAGIYRFAALDPGVYRIEFRMEGFETTTVADIRVSALKETVLNRTLALGAIRTDISVTTIPGADLDKSDATISKTFSEIVLRELPVSSDRDLTRLAMLSPLVVRGPGSNEFSVNGQRARNNNFIIDGVDNNDVTTTLTAARLSTPEALQEVHIQVAPFSAEFGRATGAQFAFVTKSGTNNFRGEAWDYYRGNWMEPVSLVNKRAGLKETPRFVLNQFGGDLGGPIIKNRTFFFGLLEGTLRREAPDARNVGAVPPNIPTPAGYAALQTVPLRTGQSTASRQAMLDALRFLPEVHTQVQQYENVRTVSVSGVPIEIGTVRIPLAKPQTLIYNVGRIDHQLTERDSLSYRYYLDHRDEPDLVSNTTFGPRWTASQNIFAQNHSVSHTHTFGPRFVNEARIAYVRKWLDFPQKDPDSSSVQINNFFMMGGATNFPQRRLDETFQFQTVSSYVAGRNAFKFGIDLRTTRAFQRAGTHARGTWTFATMADFLNNNAATLLQAVTESTFDAQQLAQFYFFQDDFRITPNFMLNAGIRYETTSTPLGLFGATDETIRAAGVPGPAKRDKNNWAPRLGFAYSPNSRDGFLGSLIGDGRTVIRGGFGVSYDVLFYNIMSAMANNYPRVVTQQDTNILDVYPTLQPKTATAAPFSPMLAFVNVPEDLQLPTTHYWSLSVQRQLASDYELEIGYSGNRSYHMFRQSQANPPVLTPEQAAAALAGQPVPTAQSRRLNPAWGSRTRIESAGKGEYHAGYLRLDKTISEGFLVGANYTWSANLSDADEVFVTEDIALSSPQLPQDFFNYRKEWARSVFDRPHRFAVHYIYQTPGNLGSQALNYVLAGWQIGGLVEWQSGQPFTIRTGLDTQGTGTTGIGTPGRPNFNPGGIMEKDPVTNDFRTFRIPLDGTGIVTAPLIANSMSGGGNLGRNTFRGPSYQNWNLNLSKAFAVTEGSQFQIRADITNLFNHNNFRNPEARMANPAFGANTANPITDARQITLGAKLSF